MSASGLSLFANFRPFFVSHYEGSEELCREIQARYHYYCKPNQCKVTAADCCACLASRSQRHGGTMIGPKDAGFENAIRAWGRHGESAGLGGTGRPGVLVFVRVSPSTSGFLYL